jgi:Ran GTPase-activating protein (RanGAP) involved in mRNA processing and transport
MGVKAVDSIDLSGRRLGMMSAIIIGACAAGNRHLRELNLSRTKLGKEGAKALASAIRDSTSITVVDLRYNGLDTESATILANIAKEKKISLCGIKPEQTEADFKPSKNGYNEMKSADAILLSADLTVRASLTRVDVRYNGLRMQDKDVLRKAVEGRSGFKLLL